MTVTAGAAPIRGWTVTLTYPAAAPVQQAWNATVNVSGTQVTATNAAYNGAVAAGATTNFGFLASGSLVTPTLACAASA